MQNKIKFYFLTFLKGLMAGLCIGLGGWLYLQTRNNTSLKIIPAFLFPIGLILICNFDFFLYTGKICYISDQIAAKQGLSYCLRLVLGLIGNYLGATLLGLLLGQTLGIPDVVNSMAQTKLNYEWWQLIVLAFFCGMLIYFAVEAFSKVENNLGKYVILVMCIAGFILCGFEHCIADMFYFSLARSFTPHTFLAIFLIIVGNSLGGAIIPLVKRLCHA